MKVGLYSPFKGVLVLITKGRSTAVFSAGTAPAVLRAAKTAWAGKSVGTTAGSVW